MAIHIPRTRLLAALALGAAFLFIIGATVSSRALTSGVSGASSEGAVQHLEDIARDPGLRFGGNQTPLPLAYAPFAVTPPAAPPRASSPYAFIWPNDYYLVQGMWAGHPLGIDIGSPPGDPVRAVRDGRVIFAGGDPCCNYGLFVIIEHDEGWSSLYAHFSRVDVSYGDEVEQAQVIGLAGATGTVSGPHVHFELRHYGGVVDPLDYLEPHRDWTVTADLLAELRQKATGSPTAADGPAFVAANEPPPPTGDPALAAHLDASGAITLGAASMAHQDRAVYEIEASSCTAALSGPNWWVTCNGQLQGCRGGACEAQLTVCVFDQPRLVTAACP